MQGYKSSSVYWISSSPRHWIRRQQASVREAVRIAHPRPLTECISSIRHLHINRFVLLVIRLRFI